MSTTVIDMREARLKWMMKVKVRGVYSWSARLHVGLWIMKLGAGIAGYKVAVDIGLRDKEERHE